MKSGTAILTSVALPLFSILIYRVALWLNQRVFSNELVCAAVLFLAAVISLVLLRLVGSFSAVLSLILMMFAVGAAHGVTTRTETTLHAVNAALTVLREDGVMTVCVYPGHDEGARERDALLAWARSLDERAWDVMLRAYLNQSGDPPLMIAVKKNRKRKRA